MPRNRYGKGWFEMTDKRPACADPFGLQLHEVCQLLVWLARDEHQTGASENFSLGLCLEGCHVLRGLCNDTRIGLPCLQFDTDKLPALGVDYDEAGLRAGRKHFSRSRRRRLLTDLPGCSRMMHHMQFRTLRPVSPECVEVGER